MSGLADILATLPTPSDADDWRKRIAAELALIPKPVNPLADATPLPWDTTPFPSEVEL